MFSLCNEMLKLTQFVYTKHSHKNIYNTFSGSFMYISENSLPVAYLRLTMLITTRIFNVN